MRKDIFIGLFIWKLLDYGFEVGKGFNQKMCHLKNKKGNTIYLTEDEENGVGLNVYRQTASAFNPVVITSLDEETIVKYLDLIINKLKLKKITS